MKNVLVWVTTVCERVLVPVEVVVGAAGRGSGLGLEASAEGGWSMEGFPAAPPAAGCSPLSPADHTAPPAETISHTLVRREIIRSTLCLQKNTLNLMNCRDAVMWNLQCQVTNIGVNKIWSVKTYNPHEKKKHHPAWAHTNWPLSIFQFTWLSLS